MWRRGWREGLWDRLAGPWDVIVVGGGITGAGILAEAARLGLRVLLVEAGDFASGTSSRSSKLVHGGLRYLKQAQFRLTIESVRERDRLLREGEGLVTPLGLLLASFEGDRTRPWVFALGLFLYDIFARRWAHEKLTAEEVLRRAPSLRGSSLTQAYHYYDAQTDDARLVLRLVREAVRRGAVAVNYAAVESLLRDRSGRVVGVALRDRGGSERTFEVKARVVVSATGAWADRLRAELGKARRLRQIRGSHLIFSGSRLPLGEAVTLMHPRDDRAVFAIPWEGVTLVGTTDVDHREPMEEEPCMSAEEAEYLLALARHAFPQCELGPGDVLASYSGVRPVVTTGAADPTKEPREHALWKEEGLLTVTGGKLTTFRVMAREALRAIRRDLPAPTRPKAGPILDGAEGLAVPPAEIDAGAWGRLVGRHGRDAPAVAGAGDARERIDGTSALWNELRWAARDEGVVRLEDLLLRRVRLGLLLAEGGLALLPRIRAVAQPELGWDDDRWEAEERCYRETWTRRYAPPR